MTETVPMSAPDINEADVAAVTAVLRSGQLARGPCAEAFERAVATRIGVRHAIATSSGTAALHLIVRGLGIRPGDEVLVPSYTFCASVNALLYEGAVPVFVDVEPDGVHLDAHDAQRKTTSRTVAILAVDVFGHPAEWDTILDVAARHGLVVIDDACEAVGAEYRRRPLGSIGDATAFAFYPNKQLTTGEGGMVLTNDDQVAALCRSRRNHGRGDTGFDPVRLGYNYCMDEMSAALGRSQWARLDALLAARERVAALYSRRLEGMAHVQTPCVAPHVRMSWFVYVVTLADGMSRDRVMDRLAARGVPSRGYFSAVHRMPYMRDLVGTVALPRTERLAQRTLALPFHGRMTDAEVEAVVTALEHAVSEVRA